ncbi:hypothetical protein ONZ45_g18353 [Pleurotus djamor]|nr:hypothetical protein ONZ45_g18353 [Pleurotus djamor]
MTTSSRNPRIVPLETVPHHTANSWVSHWAIRHELADKIFAHAKKSIAEVDSSSDEDDEDEDSGSDYGVSKPSSLTRPLRRPNYKDLSSSEPSEELSFDEVDNDLTDADAHGSDDDDAPRAKRTHVSTKASPLSFGDGDLRLMARHIASTPDFADLPSGERWKPFTDKHPQRSHKAWMEQYRRRKDELDKMAKQIRRKRDAENHIPVKQERSSVPLSAPPPPLPRLGVSTGSNIPPSKRKLGDFDGGPEQIKRYKDNCAE